MRRFVAARWPWVLVLAACCGCAENSMVLQGQVDRYQQQQLAMSRQYEQLRQRAAALDRDNQELGALLAQTRQQAKVLDDQTEALQEQLRGITQQLADARAEKENREKQVQALTASLRRRGGVSITPNNSLLQTLPAIDLPGVFVRRDGDVIRVALPASRLFDSQSARLQPGAAALISNAALEIVQDYPEQIVGVEGHTDTDPVAAGSWRNNHELSVAWAMAVYDVLVGRTRLRREQLFVVGHGPNHPIHSNATPEGKQGNRRVELVVYPETWRQGSR